MSGSQIKSTDSRSGMSLVILRAVIFTLLINLPHLVSYINSNGHAPSSLNDQMDETLYLRAALDQGRFLPQEAIYYEHAKPISFFDLITRWRPDQTFSHFIVGAAAHTFGLGILELNFALDLICGVAGYILFYLFFLNLLGRSHSSMAEIMCIVLLAYPWVASLENWMQVHPLIPEFSAVIHTLGNPVLPIQEGLESQLSLVWFALALLLLAKLRLNQYSSSLGVLCLGLLAGTFIYVYVLAWLAISVLIPAIILCDTLFVSNETKRGREGIFKNLKTLVFFGLGNLLAATAGIIQIYYIRSSKHIFVDDASLYREAFYLPTEWLVTLVVLAIITWRLAPKISELPRILLVFLLATILAEVILMNIQPIAGFATVGIFILGIYTRPLLTAVVFGILFHHLSGKREFSVIFKSSVWILLLLAGAQSYFAAAQDDSELTDLIAYVDVNIPKPSTLAMLTFNKPFQSTTKEWEWRAEPNIVAALTENYLLKECLGLEWGALPAEENISRELALATVFTGKPQIIRECNNEILTEPKSMFFQQWIAIQLSRRDSCRKADSIIKLQTACRSIKAYRVDYVIWENEFDLAVPEYLKNSSKLVWASKSGKYQLLKFDQLQAEKLLCSQSV